MPQSQPSAPAPALPIVDLESHQQSTLQPELPFCTINQLDFQSAQPTTQSSPPPSTNNPETPLQPQPTSSTFSRQQSQSLQQFQPESETTRVISRSGSGSATYTMEKLGPIILLFVCYYRICPIRPDRSLPSQISAQSFLGFAFLSPPTYIQPFLTGVVY
ncbi:hypothetical protein V6N13_039452 [Hibiscus sabdariffa]|uniref:Uncharacterized protein n=1 Tax=Hibiscus sabdariffa TaxID=183260 RepID=A0ABR2SVK1_9ROSI